LAEAYGIAVKTLKFLPIGYDARSFLYEVAGEDGTAYFLKLRSVPVPRATVLIPELLLGWGHKQFIAPIKTRGGELTCAIDSYTAVLYPYVRGRNGAETGLTGAQWAEFGRALRAVYDSRLSEQFKGELPRETFAFKAGERMRAILTTAGQGGFASEAAQRLAAFFVEKAEVIEEMIGRGEGLGQALQAQNFEFGLCHTDCHLWNVLVGEDGGLYLVDWDGPMLAPRERDLFFVVGVKGVDEAAFFEGYGAVAVNQEALAYYRYERVVEDMGESGWTGLVDGKATEAERVEADRFTRGLFGPGGSVEWARGQMMNDE
jgi:spectinomycin phosphotransferase